MSNAKLEIINRKLEELKQQKAMIEQKEKSKNRKLLNKQKIIIGGYLINKIKTMDSDRKNNLKQQILSTIKPTREKDIDAVNKLFETE